MSPGACARSVLAAIAIVSAAGSLALDLPKASQAEFWGDGATYYAMAWSLARDGDLRFEPRDLERVRVEYPRGPQGLFLKRAAGGIAWQARFPWLRRVAAEEGRLYYAKPFIYPLLAAPFVALFGTRGLVLTNALLFALVLALACETLLRRRFPPWSALAVALSICALCVAPLYVVWVTPEITGLALVTCGLWAWAARRPMLSALLFGIAGYAKPPNVLLAVPLLIEPLLPAEGAPAIGRRLLVALGRGMMLAVAAASLYGANAAVTGEANYQGGERKTFYGRFPFDERGSSFESAGFWMTTNQAGPLVEGRDDAKVSDKSGPARKRWELLQSFARNLVYFWIGRFGGALAYFPAAVAALALFLCCGSRGRPGWLALLAVCVSWFAYVWLIPDNWYGGGGTVGNRYFLNLLPAFLFLVPLPRARLVVLSGVAGAFVFLAPLCGAPIHHSLRPGEHATRGAFRLLPAELTMLNDLAVFTESWRKKRAFGLVGGPDRRADADAFFLYFMDDGTYGKETWSGRAGFWLRAGEPAEVVVRALDLAPLEAIRLRLTGGPFGDRVDVGTGWSAERFRLGPGQVRELTLPVSSGVPYYDTYLHVLRLASERGSPLPDGRPVGTFVEITLQVGKAVEAR